MQNKMMVAQGRFPYRQKMLEEGEEFEPESERDATALRLAGKAKDKHEDGDAGAQKRTYRRRDMKAEQ